MRHRHAQDTAHLLLHLWRPTVAAAAAPGAAGEALGPPALERRRLRAAAWPHCAGSTVGPERGHGRGPASGRGPPRGRWRPAMPAVR